MLIKAASNKGTLELPLQYYIFVPSLKEHKIDSKMNTLNCYLFGRYLTKLIDLNYFIDNKVYGSFHQP